MRPDLGRLGIWAQEYKLNPTLVAELEAMGYGTVWLGARPTVTCASSTNFWVPPPGW